MARSSTCSCLDAVPQRPPRGSSPRRYAITANKLEIITDKSPTLASVIADLVPDPVHCTEQYLNNRIGCDHRRLKARSRPMRGLKTDRTASVIVRGHALVQNIRRGHYQFDCDTDPAARLEAAFEELRSALER